MQRSSKADPSPLFLQANVFLLPDPIATDGYHSVLIVLTEDPEEMVSSLLFLTFCHQVATKLLASNFLIAFPEVLQPSNC